MRVEHSKSAALRELIDEQKNAMKLDVGGRETFEFVVVVLDALRRRGAPKVTHQRSFIG